MEENKIRYDLKLQSAILQLQLSFSEYKKAISKYYKSIWIDDKGDICILGDIEEHTKKIKQLEDKYLQDTNVVADIKNKIKETNSK